MKKKLSVFFLVILSLPAIYKAGLFTFYQFNKDYIAANYCVNKERPITMCYGKCFLDKGLALADQAPNPGSIVPQLKFEVTEFVIDDVDFSLSSHENGLTFSSSLAPTFPNGVSSFIFHPPLV